MHRSPPAASAKAGDGPNTLQQDLSGDRTVDDSSTKYGGPQLSCPHAHGQDDRSPHRGGPSTPDVAPAVARKTALLAGGQGSRMGCASLPAGRCWEAGGLKCQKSPASDFRRVRPFRAHNYVTGKVAGAEAIEVTCAVAGFTTISGHLGGCGTRWGDARWTSSSGTYPRWVTEQDVSFGYQTGRCAAGPAPERQRDRRVAGEWVRPGAGSRARVPVRKVEGHVSQSAG